jgi:hypothetical protein
MCRCTLSQQQSCYRSQSCQDPQDYQCTLHRIKTDKQTTERVKNTCAEHKSACIACMQRPKQAWGTCCITIRRAPRQHENTRSTARAHCTSFPTCLLLGACALHCPVAGCLACSCDRPTAEAARAVADCARHRAVATIKVATCRSLGDTSAHCRNGRGHTRTPHMCHNHVSMRVMTI